MKKIICIILLLSCVLISHAEDPIEIFRVKALETNYSGRWSRCEHKGMIFFYTDKIVNKSDTGVGEFYIMGDVEQYEGSDGSIALMWECLNENLNACLIVLTYHKEYRRRCVSIVYSTHEVRYILKNDDEY